MISGGNFFPIYNGHSLGSIIEEVEYMVPMLHHEVEALSEEIRNEEFKKEEMQKDAEWGKLDGEAKTSRFNAKNQLIASRQKRLKAAMVKLQEYYGRDPVFALQEYLPIDYKRSEIVTRDLAFSSERTYHMALDKDLSPWQQVDHFISQLFLQNSPGASLPPGAVDSLIIEANAMLKSAIKISFVGSVVTLPRVRTYDPIVVRKEAVSKKLRENSDRYYVLTEVVMGAVFLGLGKHIKGTGDPTKGPLDESKMTDIHLVSFFSQGVIPTTNEKEEDINMHQIYIRWKKSLIENKDSGYPIAVRYRRLTDLFNELGVPLISSTPAPAPASSSDAAKKAATPK